MNRPFEWQAAADGLHAIPSTVGKAFPPLPGTEVTTLCALRIILEHSDFRRTHRPMCGQCHSAWVAYQRTVEQPRPKASNGLRADARVTSGQS